MKKVLILTSILLAGTWHAVLGQFVEGIGDPNVQIGRSVQTVSNNRFIIAGAISGNTPFGQIDANVTLANGNGGVVWSTAIGDARNDIFNSIRETGITFIPSRFVAAGSTRSFGFGSEDMYLVGIDGTGFPQFARVYGGANRDVGYCVQRITHFPTQQPGYVIVGETRSFSNFLQGSNVYVVRTDANGNSLDQAVVGTPGEDIGYWIEQTRDGGYLIAGTTSWRCEDLDSVENRNIFVARLDADLNMVWNTIISGPGNEEDVAYCVRENTINNSIIVTGNTRSFGNESQVFLLNLDPLGGFNWMNVYGGHRRDYGQNVLITQGPFNQPQYLVAGFSDSYNSTFNFDAMMFKTTMGGNVLWTRIYGGLNTEYGYEVDDIPTAAAGLPGYVLTGLTESFGAGDTNILLVRTNNLGQTGGTCELSIQQGPDMVTPCRTSGAQSVPVNSWTIIPYDGKPLQYTRFACQPTSGTQSEIEVETSVPSNITVGPNPTTSDVHFNVDASFEGSAVSVMNGSGTVVHTTTISGEQATIDLNGLMPGIYIAKVIKPDGSVVTIRILKK